MVILNANYTPTKRKLQIYFPVPPLQTLLSSFPARFQLKGCEERLRYQPGLRRSPVLTRVAGPANGHTCTCTCRFHLSVSEDSTCDRNEHFLFFRSPLPPADSLIGFKSGPLFKSSTPSGQEALERPWRLFM